MTPPRMLIVDASNLAARTYHVAARGREGESVYGLARHGLKRAAQNLMTQVDPLRVVVALDSQTGNFRKAMYPTYKGHRGEKPEELDRLMKDAGNILREEIGGEVYEAPDFEADDVIATVAQAALPYGWRNVICSNDKDLLSLVCDLGGGAGTFCLHSDKGSYTSVGPAEVQAKLGVPPLRVPFLKSIQGDVSDGLPGCPGLGPVAAKRLANEYRSPAHLFENLHRLQRTDRTRLEAAGKDHLELMLRLVTLRADAPLRQAT